MDFETCLDRYADLLISWALNIQPGQPLYIGAEPIHRHFCQKLAKRAYEKGASFVSVDYVDPELSRLRIQETLQEDDLAYVPKWLPGRYHEMLDDKAAVVRLVGSENPDALSDQDPKRVNKQQLAFRKTLKRYYEEGVGKGIVAWNVCAHPTPAWAKKVFPDLEPEAACKKLWEEVFKICRVDRPDYIEAWDEHNRLLKKRGAILDELKIKALHFVGPGTDLRVYLSPKARFKGGNDLSGRNVYFEPNIPTEECFTTPDYRLTEGKARVTRPVNVNGKLIEGLELEFKNGEIVHFSAKKGEATFREYISCDEGAKRLGEVALVGCDSPIFQTGHIYQEILFDENAACHIAVGFAYTFCLKGGESMNEAELKEVGCNKSACHLDMMISDESVDVFAESYLGTVTPLIKKGNWVI
jgi:aminopeptidase